MVQVLRGYVLKGYYGFSHRPVPACAAKDFKGFLRGLSGGRALSIGAYGDYEHPVEDAACHRPLRVFNLKAEVCEIGDNVLSG